MNDSDKKYLEDTIEMLELRVVKAETSRDVLFNSLRNVYKEGFEYAVAHNLPYTYVDPDRIAELLGLNAKEEMEYFRLRREKQNARV